MTRRGGLVLTVAAFVAAVFVPLEPAHADLLGGLTDALDETVESTESVLDGSVDAATDVIDDTAGSTGTALDESVDDLTDVVATTSDGLTDAVVTTSDGLTEVVAATSDGLTDVVGAPANDVAGTEDASTTTLITEAEQVTPITTSSAPTRVTKDTTTSPSSATFAAPPEPVDDPVGGSPHDDRVSIAANRTNLRSVESSDVLPDERAFIVESLTVLSAAGGFTGPAILEPVAVGSGLESSLYGRLLDWLTSAGSGMRALLAGPLLALEIVIRALFSAGSGLVAPISLFGAYLTQLMWRSRATGPIASPVPSA